MLKKRSLFQAIFILSSLLLAACQNGTGSTTGTLSINVPTTFPASTAAQTITVNLATNPSANGGALGFSNLTLHTTIGTALSLLTIDPSSSCLAINAQSTATSCTFIVTNTNGSSSAASILNASGYYVTGQLGGQTVTSNTDHPGASPEPPTPGAYWTITINNSASTNQYLFVFGLVPGTANTHEVVVFDNPTGTNHYGSFQTYSSTTPYGSNEDSIILQPGENTIHIPFGIESGRAYISNIQMKDLELTSNGGIVTPSPWNSSDANYDTIYDDFEIDYDTTGSNTAAVVNQTAVDFLSTPICLQGSTSYQPVHQSGYCNISRTTLLTDVKNILTGSGVPSEWGSLILTNGSTTLRIMNPGDEASSFENYFNSYLATLATTYGTDNSLVVQNNGATLSGKIVTTAGPTYTYEFTCTAGACGTGTSMPLSAANLLTGSAPSADNNLVTAYQMISSAFMAGQLPPTVSGTSPITEGYLQTQSSTFYTQPSMSSGYQYSVFSNALNTVGKANNDDNIYTWAYDDVLGKSSTMTQSLTGPTDEPEPLTVTVNPN